MISLYPSKEFKYPIFAECITPDVFQDKKTEEIKMLKIWEGNRQKMLGELFKVEEVKPKDSVIAVHGNVIKVRRIGANMTCGEIAVEGNVGMHLGEEMCGGKIIVHGNVEGWAASMMKSGEIEVHGNVGDYLCAPYRGGNVGMLGGRVIVHGNVGSHAGAYMKRGLIKIHGSAGQFAGFRMRNGAIYVQKDCGERVGACMLEGKIVVKGSLTSVLPTFTIDSIKTRVKIEEAELAEGPFYVFVGDVTENGNGKLYVSKEKNPHLSNYEKFL